MKTVIISDIHLGSKNCQASWLLRFLGTNFDRLIVNGDTINNLNLKKLKDSHWAVLDRLREIGLQRELIMIRGNHDGRVTRARIFMLPSAQGVWKCPDASGTALIFILRRSETQIRKARGDTSMRNKTAHERPSSWALC